MKTKEFIEARDLLLQNNHQFVSIDETSFGTNSQRIFQSWSKAVCKEKDSKDDHCFFYRMCFKRWFNRKKSVTGCFNTERFLKFLKDLNLCNSS